MAKDYSIDRVSGALIDNNTGLEVDDDIGTELRNIEIVLNNIDKKNKPTV